MRQLNGIYAQHFNSRHHRVGHLFQGRFKAIIVERENYLLELSRYIVLNPVRAKMVAEVAQYRWSSYAPTAGLLEPPTCLTTEWLLNQFSSHKQLAMEQYRRFVSEGLAATTPWTKIKHQLFLGSDAFVEHVAPLLDGHENVTEIPRKQRFANRKPLDALFQGFNIDNRDQRDHAIVRAHYDHGYKLIEIAHHLALHYSTISKIVSHSRSKM